MKITVWNECYISGGADWSLIDLIASWPNESDEFLIYINQSHEGYRLISEKTAGRAQVKSFRSFYELTSRVGQKLPRLLSKGILKRVVMLPVYLWASLYSVFAYKSLVSADSADVLLINNGGYPGGLSNYFIAVIARLKGIKRRVMIVRNYPQYQIDKQPLMKIIRSLCYFSLEKIVCVSDSLKEAMIKEGGLDVDFLQRIYNGIEVSNKLLGDAPKIFEDDGCIKVGIIGGFEPRKGHDVLFKAWAAVVKEIPTAKLFVVGSSTSGNTDALKNLAATLKISDSLVWCEFIKNVGHLYKELDIVVMPSKNFESFGRIVVETMAFKKVIVASRVGGIPELIADGEDGFLFESENHNELAKILIKVILSKELREIVGTCAFQKYSNHFTAKHMADRYFQLLSAHSTA